jgi:hypothetical protein
MLDVNTPSSGSFSVKPILSAIGFADFSSKTSLMLTSMTVHRWFSDTFITVKTSRSMKLNGAWFAVSLCLKQVSSQNSQSFGMPILSVQQTNGGAASTGTNILAVSGERFGSFRVTSAVRIAASSCLANTWISDSFVLCKTSYGQGIISLIIVTGSIGVIPLSQKLTPQSTIYRKSMFKSFSVVDSSVLILGNDLGQVSPNDITTGQISDIFIPQHHSRIILSSTALLEQRAITKIMVSITIGQISRLDDVTFILEVLSSNELDVATQIVLFQDQCFGCLFGVGEWISLNFVDDAVASAPLSQCSLHGSYRPKYSNFASIYSFYGIMRLLVISGSSAITIQTASIVVSRSSITLLFFQNSSSNVVHVVASKAIFWTSDSAFSSFIPAVIGKKISLQGIVYQQNTNVLYDFGYPSAKFKNISKTVPSSGSSLLSLMGTFFGQFDVSSRLRIGGCSCSATAWISDYNILCKSLASGQHYHHMYLQASVAKTVDGGWNLLQYSSNFRTLLSKFQPSSDSTSVSLNIFGTGSAGSTMKLRFCLSSAKSTQWFSDSSIKALSHFSCQTNLISTSINRHVVTMPIDSTKYISFSQITFIPSIPRTASNFIGISGNRLGSSGQSAKAGTEHSLCPSSVWISESSVICRIPQALLKGSTSFMISAGNYISSSEILDELYNEPLSDGKSQFELHPFEFSNASMSFLEQLQFSSIGSNYGFADTMQVGSTRCRKMMWSSQSSVACTIYSPMPYSEPFVSVLMEHSGDKKYFGTVNSRYLPSKYSIESSVMTSISTPPAQTFSTPSWIITSFKTFQNLDISFHFFNTNSEPYMKFFEDEFGIQQYSRVPILISIKIEIQNFGLQVGSILCQDTIDLNTMILAGERHANITFSNGFCAESSEARFKFSICLTSDETQLSLFSAGKLNNVFMANTSLIVLYSPTFSVQLFAPFLGSYPITPVPLSVIVGSVQSMIPSFEIKTKTFCSDTYVVILVNLICSQGRVKFSIKNSAAEFNHWVILKYSCNFIMPDWFPIKADDKCYFQLFIPGIGMDAISTTFAVVPSHVAYIKSDDPLTANNLISGDFISNNRDSSCYTAVLYDRFGNVVTTDKSRVAMLSAIYSNGQQNTTYPLNGTLQSNFNENGVLKWCNVQATRVVTYAHLTIKLAPMLYFDTNLTYVFQLFSVSKPGKASDVVLVMNGANTLVNQSVNILAINFSLPPITMRVEDSFQNSLGYIPGLIARLTVTPKSRSRNLFFLNDDHNLRPLSVTEAAKTVGCIDYIGYDFQDLDIISQQEDKSVFVLQNLKVCHAGEYIINIDLGYFSVIAESSTFVPSALSVGTLTYEVIQGIPFMISLTDLPNINLTVLQTQSFIIDKFLVEILDSGFNVVSGTANISLSTSSGLFEVRPPSLHIIGGKTVLPHIWLSGFSDLSYQSFDDSLTISTSSLKIVSSKINVLIQGTCLPGQYLPNFVHLPSSVQCEPCPPGSASSQFDSKRCTMCNPGTFSAQDARSCIQCPTGSATNTIGSTSCRRCSTSHFSNKIGTECVTFMFVNSPSVNVIPFTTSVIPPVRLFDEISQETRNSVSFRIELICLKGFNCTNTISPSDGLVLYSKLLQISTKNPFLSILLAATIISA